MAGSRKQTDANRDNAKKSTGPKTRRGKKASSANAVKHGLTASGWLDDEERDAYFLTLRALADEYDPQTATEEILVKRVVLVAAKRQRISIAARDDFIDDDRVRVWNGEGGNAAPVRCKLLTGEHHIPGVQIGHAEDDSGGGCAAPP